MEREIRDVYLPVNILLLTPKVGLVFLQLTPKMVEAQVDCLLVGISTVLGRQLLLIDLDVNRGGLFGGGRIIFAENDVGIYDAVVKLLELTRALRGILANPITDVHVSGGNLRLKGHGGRRGYEN
jgi:hypothetical protein